MNADIGRSKSKIIILDKKYRDLGLDKSTFDADTASLNSLNHKYFSNFWEIYLYDLYDLRTRYFF
jgi:hypothetical protein